MLPASEKIVLNNRSFFFELALEGTRGILNTKRSRHMINVIAASSSIIYLLTPNAVLVASNRPHGLQLGLLGNGPLGKLPE